MKALKLLLFGLFLIFGGIIAYFAFIAFDGGNTWIAILYGILSVVLVCVGFVGIVLLFARKNVELQPASAFVPVTVVSKNERSDPDGSAMDPVTQPSVAAKQNPTFPSINKVDLSLRPITVPDDLPQTAPVRVEEPVGILGTFEESLPKTSMFEVEIEEMIETQPDVVQPKEDPHFLFGDWWVDADGLYIDVRLIGITGRKQQRALRKLAEGTPLNYDADLKKETIALRYGKTTIGFVPEIYRKTVLTYADGIASASIANLVRKRRDTLQCDVRIRFDDALREKLQKKLQLSKW